MSGFSFAPDLSGYALNNFVSNTPMTVASLLATYPAGSGYLGKYARVTDLWGNTDEVMRCCTDGSSYFWRPQRTDYAASTSLTGGAMTLTPLVTAPTLFVSGTLLSAGTVTPSATNAWPGAQFAVTFQGTLGIFGITINNLVGGGTLPLLTGTTRVMTYTAAGWKGA